MVSTQVEDARRRGIHKDLPLVVVLSISILPYWIKYLLKVVNMYNIIIV